MHRIVMILHQSHLSGRNRNDFISHTVGWKPYSAKKKRPVYRYESRFIRLHSECNSARKHWPPLTEMLHYFGRRCKEPFSLTATTKRNSNNSFSWSGTRKRLFSAPIQTHHTRTGVPSPPTPGLGRRLSYCFHWLVRFVQLRVFFLLLRFSPGQS